MDKNKTKRSRASLSATGKYLSCFVGFILLFLSLLLLSLSFTFRRCKLVIICSVLFASLRLSVDMMRSGQEMSVPMIHAPSKISDWFIPFDKTGLLTTLEKGSQSKMRTIQCQGGYNMTLSQWLSQDSRNSSALCESTFDESMEQKVNLEKPVQVFIMLGESSNMLGRRSISDTNNHAFPHSLEYTTVKEKKRFPHLLDKKGQWSIQKNVRTVGISSESVYRNEWLGEFKTTRKKGSLLGLRPDLQFGYIMSQVMADSSVLILESSCLGNRSLGWDLLPPGSPEYEHDGYVYAGSGNLPEQWEFGKTANPKPVKRRHPGNQYGIDVANVLHVLENLKDFYPGITHGKYEIAGFVWRQGDRDLHSPGWVHRYEKNLVTLIHGLRRDFDAPHAKFAIATIGGYNMTEEASQVFQAQLAVSSGKYPYFRGNVQTVDLRSSWREADEIDESSHYHRQAETYLETGNALGWAMANMLLKHH